MFWALLERSEGNGLKMKVRVFLAFIISYLISRIIFYFTGFQYMPFTEGFKALKLLIDFGTWALIYTVSYWALGKIDSKIKDNELS